MLGLSLNFCEDGDTGEITTELGVLPANDFNLVEQMVSVFKENSVYELLTVENLRDMIFETRSIYEEIKSRGFKAFSEKYSQALPEDLRAIENDAEATVFALEMYKSLISLYERLYNEKQQK